MHFRPTLIRSLSLALLAAFSFSYAAPAFAANSVVHISRNWAGYGAGEGTYTGVSGTWAVPKSAASSGNVSADAEWVGIGGLATKDLIQAGTQTVFINGKVQYQAWYETLPDAQRMLPITITAGDTVTVSLEEARPGVWHLTFANRTSGTTYETDIAYASSHSSAEWIVERPLAITSDGTGYLPLNEFGTVTVSGAGAIKNGARVSLENTGAEALYMNKDRYYLLATTSQANTGSFAVTYLNPFQGRAAMRQLVRDYRTVTSADQPSRAPATSIEMDDQTIIIHIVF